jgi:hypothetical protein
MCGEIARHFYVVVTAGLEGGRLLVAVPMREIEYSVAHRPGFALRRNLVDAHDEFGNRFTG